ncbi:hypothetical protein C8R44DRAFT_863617 [Mycena epipterygia]|nr:hypothetical protein C8R44DRAFT_863617 [Mycena epipterygia]
MSPASELASDLIRHELPALTTRLHKYEEQTYDLECRHDNLVDEIARVRRSIAWKKTQQVRFADELAYIDKDLAKCDLKRQRSQDEPERRVLRPRVEGPNDRGVSQNFDLKSSDSELSMGTKRKGRVFSDEEAASF